MEQIDLLTDEGKINGNVGFIGAGNMAEAMFSGMIKNRKSITMFYIF